MNGKSLAPGKTFSTTETPVKNAQFSEAGQTPKYPSFCESRNNFTLHSECDPIIPLSSKGPGGTSAQSQRREVVSLCSMSRNRFQLIPSQLGLPASLPPLDENHQWGLYDFAN